MSNPFVPGAYLVVFPHKEKRFKFFVCFECSCLIANRDLQLAFAKFEDKEQGSSFLQSVLSKTYLCELIGVRDNPCQLHLAYPVTPLCPEEVTTSSRSPCAPTTLIE